tara:strand:- start:54 stop:530 length:477 start_codon:yes stop_codon:yes gene_type:complete
MKNKYNRNPKGSNQWEKKTNEEIQKIIDFYPSDWSKKDFRGEGSKNSKKILTRHETQRESLVFGAIGRHKKYKDGKLQCSICKKFKSEDDFPIDNNVVSNKRRSNCKNCEVKRYQNYTNSLSNTKLTQMYQDRYKNLTEEQLKSKRNRDKEYRERLKN